ncbi:MAG TPA: hypothetical protein VG125_13625 [Pirellulales bacterium]|jgi:hypothetical protein|nr:hypothetical protein [Pirellulales bacterium]
MNRSFCVLFALVIVSVLSADSQARVFGRRRGGGGNMGANSGVCNMALSPIKPQQCVGGACNLQVEPVPAAAPAAPVNPGISFGSDAGDEVIADVNPARKASRSSRHSFDAPEAVGPREVVARR